MDDDEMTRLAEFQTNAIDIKPDPVLHSIEQPRFFGNQAADVTMAEGKDKMKEHGLETTIEELRKQQYASQQKERELLAKIEELEGRLESASAPTMASPAARGEIVL